MGMMRMKMVTLVRIRRSVIKGLAVCIALGLVPLQSG